MYVGRSIGITIHSPCKQSNKNYTNCRKTGNTLNVYDGGMNSKQIGSRLRAHRENYPRVPLRRLASETKSLTIQRISNYEQGIRLLKAKEAKILADAFKRLGKPITASELLGIQEEGTQQERPERPRTAKGGALTRQEEALLSVVRQLPPSERNRFLEAIRAVASACGINIKKGG
jgi:hypothetical protein